MNNASFFSIKIFGEIFVFVQPAAKKSVYIGEGKYIPPELKLPLGGRYGHLPGGSAKGYIIYSACAGYTKGELK